MPQDTAAEKAMLIEQQNKTIEWLSHINLIEFIRLEIAMILGIADDEREEHIASICQDVESFEVQELAMILIGMMPDSYQTFYCIKEDVCAHLMVYLSAALAPL